MTITAGIKRATRRTFRASAGELKQVTYLKYGEEAYDPETKTSSRPIALQKTVPAFVTSFTEQEILAGVASPEDQRVTIEGTRVTWEVSTHDELQIDGKTWRILKNKTPLTKAVVILQVEKG